MKLSDIGTSVDTLSGVGPSTAKLFARLNIFTVGQLLCAYPRDYEDRTKTIPLADYAKVKKIHSVCTVTGHSWFGYGKMKTLKILITDGSASAFLIAFNRKFLETAIPVGSIALITGSFQVKYGELQSTDFDVQRLSYDGNREDFNAGKLPQSRVIPIYPLTEGLSQKVFHKAITGAIKQYGKAIDNEIPDDIICQRKLLSKAQAIIQIHEPQNLNQAEEAKHTLVYEELYHFEYNMAKRAIAHRGFLPAVQDSSEEDTPPSAAPFFTTPDLQKEKFLSSLSPLQKQLLERLPFDLTQDQMLAIYEMNQDIDKSEKDLNAIYNTPEKITGTPFSMQRLLQGDVGSGKTLVCFFLCLRIINYGGQCALLAPTELLARQHAENAAKLLEPLGVRPAFLTGNLTSAGRGRLLTALKNGDINIAVGTHALFSANVQYKNLQLAIIDEQHRFGVAQRESIIDKGRITHNGFYHSPDVLMMSATPIPQTLAFTLFGDLDISIIKTMPAGRKSVKTYLSIMGHEHNVYDAVRQELLKGHQAYFVYPRIGEKKEASEKENLKSAEEMTEYLSSIYKDFKCATIHSKTDEEQQHQILDDFRNNKIQILVATTVVEVGVDVPNATCIVIEHADRFGLAELHQLRGRVGRSSLQSYCFLIYGKNITENGIERLKALHESTDGFVIAEKDLKLRGPGEIAGTAQSGYLAFGLADLARDKNILTLARYDAFTQAKKDFMESQAT
ncbi:MAG: ATP-dependent DNA helicase RecG [Treponema sp.]|nr:ATP-dependent DNA helicase RecG [Treponema sp.]